MKFQRVLTADDQPAIKWKHVDVMITANDGRVVFEQAGVEVPEHWSQNAASMLAQKYFRKAGVPDKTARTSQYETNLGADQLPGWLHPSIPEFGTTFGGETSARQVFRRLAGCWTYHGWREGLFTTPADGWVFYDEIFASLALQYAAPNSPQWFNTGLHWAYGIEGPDSGQWIAREVLDVTSPRHLIVERTLNSYEYPQPHACFIQSVEDDLVNPGGMMDLWVREARLFKHGSGTGSNFSKVRGKNEKLSGGGVSSGLISFLRVGDRSAGSISSGGVTRRAAKMVVVDADHPDIMEFINWKSSEEYKAACIAVGSKVIYDQLSQARSRDPVRLVPRRSDLPANAVIPQCLVDRALAGEDNWPVYQADSFEGEAIETVSGQNANDSVRVTNEFMRRVSDDERHQLIARTTGEVLRDMPARELFDKLCWATWASGDPGIQYADTINEWGTCSNDGNINASNPCFSGDTLVWTVYGPKRFDDLAASGVSIPVLTELSSGLLGYRLMTNPRLTRKSAEVVRITFKAQRGTERRNSFTTLDCTLDHEFYLSDGTTKRAMDLCSGDSIESAGRRANQKGYIGVYNTNGDSIMEHNLIAEYDYGRRPVYPEEHGHHKDENKANNIPGNIEILPGPEHNAEHIRGDLNPMRRWFGSLNDEDSHTVVSVEQMSITVPVYCGTVKETGRFFVSLGTEHAEGVLVSNCSEYLFLDDTACNLASIRLTKFLPLDERAIALFEHIVRLWTVVLEISVFMASFPSEAIARNTYNYRTLGLGYADLGGLLMRMAIPYASDEGRSLAAALTALMTGVVYQTSAEMAEEVGPFSRWEANKERMCAVLRNHARAAGVDFISPEYEGLSIKPMPALTVAAGGAAVVRIFQRIDAVWLNVLAAKSFRNAQATVLAPTGTISFVMDCDTTGVEPDFSLVKYKKLSGGGDMKIVNQAVPEALQWLGYSEHDIEHHLEWILTHGHIAVENESLKSNGIKRWHMGIFACAGDISPEDHVRMVAAVQPFLSGGISKTINMPNYATVADVHRVYFLAHQLGVKALAPFRDGSKLSQPLSSVSDSRFAQHDVAGALKISSIDEAASDMLDAVSIAYNQGVGSDGLGLLGGPELLKRGEREYLPWRRKIVWKQKIKLGEQTVYLDVSEYPDGRPGEIFLEIAKQGSMLRALGDALSIAVSIGLQYGVPVSKYVEHFAGMKFEPAGYIEGHDRIKFVSSIVDYIGKELGITYAGRDDLANTPTPIEDAVQRIADVVEKVDEQWRTTLKYDAEFQGVTAHAKLKPTGDSCPRCGDMLVRNGTCRTCPNCTYDEGCGG